MSTCPSSSAPVAACVCLPAPVCLSIRQLSVCLPVFLEVCLFTLVCFVIHQVVALQITSVQSDDYSDIPNSQIRRITAKRLLESKQTVPHYYLTIDCRVDKLVQLRQQLNAGLAKDGKKLSVNDFVIKASAQVGSPTL